MQEDTLEYRQQLKTHFHSTQLTDRMYFSITEVQEVHKQTTTYQVQMRHTLPKSLSVHVQILLRLLRPFVQIIEAIFSLVFDSTFKKIKHYHHALLTDILIQHKYINRGVNNAKESEY